VTAVREAIALAAQPLAFEANGPGVWRDMERLARGVLDRLWERGALAGATRADAYTVVCDATVNPPERADAGEVVCEVGLRPPWPAELVTVRVAIRQGSPELIELSPGDA
jgi:uncharacterized protein